MSTVDSCSSYWKNLTCEKCVFQVAGECRRFPPSCYAVVDGLESSYMDSAFPLVMYSVKDSDGLFTPACAEYAEEPAKLETIWGKVE